MVITEHMNTRSVAVHLRADSVDILMELKNAGLKDYNYHVATGNIVLYDQLVEQQLLPGDIHAPQLLAPQPDPPRAKNVPARQKQRCCILSGSGLYLRESFLYAPVM